MSQSRSRPGSSSVSRPGSVVSRPVSATLYQPYDSTALSEIPLLSSDTLTGKPRVTTPEWMYRSAREKHSKRLQGTGGADKTLLGGKVFRNLHNQFARDWQRSDLILTQKEENDKENTSSPSKINQDEEKPKDVQDETENKSNDSSNSDSSDENDEEEPDIKKQYEKLIGKYKRAKSRLHQLNSDTEILIQGQYAEDLLREQLDVEINKNKRLAEQLKLSQGRSIELQQNLTRTQNKCSQLQDQILALNASEANRRNENQIRAEAIEEKTDYSHIWHDRPQSEPVPQTDLIDTKWWETITSDRLILPWQRITRRELPRQGSAFVDNRKFTDNPVQHSTKTAKIEHKPKPSSNLRFYTRSSRPQATQISRAGKARIQQLNTQRDQIMASITNRMDAPHFAVRKLDRILHEVQQQSNGYTDDDISPALRGVHINQTRSDKLKQLPSL